MGVVRLTGQLLCESQQEARLVVEHLPAHIALTRGEPGCVSFDVSQSSDPLVWQVEECFADEAAFRAHQDRVAGSEWGHVTVGIQRRYSIRGLPG